MTAEKCHSKPSLEGNGPTTIDVKATEADATSHISRRSQTASLTKQSHKAHLPGHRSAVFRWRLEPPSRRQIAKSQRHRLRQTSQPSLPVMIGDANGPDPFIGLPASTSLIEKKLFHFLMLHAPQLLFGARPRATFDFTWDVAMPNMNAGREIMSWITIPAAKMFNMHGMSPWFGEAWFLERKALNYHLLRQMLEKQDYDYGYRISSLASAGYVEFSDGILSTGFLHMKAVLALIKQQDKGLRCIQAMQPIYGSNILTIATIIGLPMIFDVLIPLEHALPTAMHSVRMLQAWNIVIRQDRKDHGGLQQPPERPRSERDVRKGTLTSPERHRYWTIRRESLGVKPLLDYLQTNDLLDEQDYEWRSRLTTLYLLNSILRNLDRNETIAESFLQDLQMMMTKSIDPGAPRVHQPYVPMIAACTQRLGIWSINRPESSLPPIRAWEAILFGEVMMLATLALRQRLMRVMFHWLYDGPEKLSESAVLGEAELLMFDVNISENWEARTNAI